jgi:lipoic acid synthetase
MSDSTQARSPLNGSAPGRRSTAADSTGVRPTGAASTPLAALDVHATPGAFPTTIAMGGGTFEPAADGSAAPRRHPEWIKARIPAGETFQELRRLLHGKTLHTVCEEAHCPNMGECWNERTATVMILGDTCTRACGFCAVKTGKPLIHDLDEPRRVAEALCGLGLDHVVITSVARDDLDDGGASIFAETIRRLRVGCPGTGVEVLIPDFNGEEAPLRTVMAAGPDILNHNVETVERLQKPVRKRARYDRSLDVLRRAKAYARELTATERPLAVHTKSSIMVGLGETRPELHQTFLDLRAVDCDILTLGQYLRPSPEHLPVERYYHPDEFAEMREEALEMGFKHVESGPLVRSSYHARDQVPDADVRRAERAERAARAAGVGSAARAAGTAETAAVGSPARAAGTSETGARLRQPTIDSDGRVVYRPD